MRPEESIEERQTHLVMTTYRPDDRRHDLCEATLRSLAETQTPATLWLIDDGGVAHRQLPDVAGILKGSAISIGAIVLGGGRIGQAGAFNRGYALAEDAVRQTAWSHTAYMVKLEDDFEFPPDWLARLIRLWESPDLALYNVGMLGGANGERGRPVEIGGQRAVLTYHVAAGCMFAPLILWRDYLPIPNRGQQDAAGGPTPMASSADWFISRRGLRSVASRGRTCALLANLIRHTGGGASTWRPNG